MASFKDDKYEFNAPRFVDFTLGIPDDTDDSYFELASETPPGLNEPKDNKDTKKKNKDADKKEEEPHSTPATDKETKAMGENTNSQTDTPTDTEKKKKNNEAAETPRSKRVTENGNSTAEQTQPKEIDTDTPAQTQTQTETEKQIEEENTEAVPQVAPSTEENTAGQIAEKEEQEDVEQGVERMEIAETETKEGEGREKEEKDAVAVETKPVVYEEEKVGDNEGRETEEEMATRGEVIKIEVKREIEPVVKEEDEEKMGDHEGRETKEDMATEGDFMKTNNIKKEAKTPRRAQPKRKATTGTKKEEEIEEKVEATVEIKRDMEEEEKGTEQDEEMEADGGEMEIKKEKSTPKGAKPKKGRRSLSVGVRQSPRLLAIAKALRRASAQRFPQPIITTGHVTKTTHHKKSSQHVPNIGGLSQNDKEELETLTTFRQKIGETAKRSKAAAHHQQQQQQHQQKQTAGKSSSSSSSSASASTSSTHHQQPLKPTRPQEFHFATDQRIRGHPKEKALPAHPQPQPRHSHSHTHGNTKPQEFTFATDARLRGKETAGAKGDEAEGPVEFAKMLRSSSTLSLNKDTHHHGTTIPQPFHFSDTRKHNLGTPQKFVSMAELNLKFVVATPERFRTKRANSVEHQGGESSCNKKARGGITTAHTPHLATSRRRRSLSVMSQEQKEEIELEEAKKHAFKARPVNKKVFAEPSTGYQVEKKQLTVPEPFNITDTKKPPPSIMDFDESYVATLPHGGLPANKPRQKTKVAPFSFDERDKTKMEQKRLKIQKVIEDEKRLAEFHAQPMPVFEGGMPARRPPTPTRPQPFNLRVDQRGNTKQEKIQQQLQKEAESDVERRRFRAQGDDVVHKKPFIPAKSSKPFTEISNFTLKTEVRAGERAEYEQQQKAAEEEMLAAKKKEEEHRMAEELAEVARMRQEAVHKAQPVPNYKPPRIHASTQPPTVPESPKFATDTLFRTRSQTRQDSTFSVDSK